MWKWKVIETVGAATLAVMMACFSFLMILGCAMLLPTGCGKGALVCSAIDIAHTACDTFPIRYMGPDGKEHVVYVPKEMLQRTAERAAAQQADAGADGGAP